MRVGALVDARRLARRLFLSVYLHWFRRDFRVRDNTALAAAARLADAVVGVFVIDTRWFPSTAGCMGPFQARFWLAALTELRRTLLDLNIPLRILTSADPAAALVALARELRAHGITFNKEYEPGQMALDRRLTRLAQDAGMQVRACKDAVIFEEFELLTGAESVYHVFTPYKRAWLAALAAKPTQAAGLPRRGTGLCCAADTVPAASAWGYATVEDSLPTGESGAAAMLAGFSGRPMRAYATQRNYPAVEGSSRLSAHLNAGTVSIRQCVVAALRGGAALDQRGGPGTWLAELIWREFYRMILFHYPHTATEAFQRRYARLAWPERPDRVAAWSRGETGYPIVDAAMRALAATGWMHNRLRMITAMFLVKDLDVHWRVGEDFFRQWLVDYDQASNVGGWQWSAGTGTDAAPYFRVMNPILQGQRFDPQGVFVRRWLPELGGVPVQSIHQPWRMSAALQKQVGCVIGRNYPAPLVDHGPARLAAIARYVAAAARSGESGG